MNKDQILKTFSKNLKHLRNHHNLSLGQMAKVAGAKSRVDVYGYEKGNALPNMSRLLNISNFLCVSINDLMQKDLTL